MTRWVTASTPKTADEWERWWAPYDEPTYQAVLDHIEPEDVVLEIGAGDLRLARLLARKARLVYAIEINPSLVTIEPQQCWSVDNFQEIGLSNGYGQVKNLHVFWADAYQYPFPTGITVGVLLMRHCQNFRLFADKLVAAGARRLITNARWRLGVEIVDLLTPRATYASVPIGWYACWCGATGFVSGPPGDLTYELEDKVHEVVDCPACGRQVDG